jgi:hypothetical protein
MNRRLFVVWLIAVIPALLSAQETKLVNCRTLEQAGNFVGPNEVIDGNMVCQKAKPGDKDAAKPELAKPQPDVDISAGPSVSVAEAARANRKKQAESKQNLATAPVAVAAPTAVASKPITEPAAAAAGPGAPEMVRNPVPAAAPAPVATVVSPPEAEPNATPPAKVPASEPLAAREPPAKDAVPVREPTPPAAAPAPAQPAPTQPVATAASVPASQPMRIKRDAPVAAGTPSEPPEKDYGFSDVNAVEPSKPASAPTRSAPGVRAPPAARAEVRMGAFNKPKEAPDAAAQSQRTNSVAGETAGLHEGQRPECTKNITLGSLKDEKLALGTPGWAETWIGKNQKALPSVCFSATPMRGARNYLIVFYIMPAGGNSNAATPMPDSASAGAFTAQNGSMWRYTGDASTSGGTKELSQGQVWYATAYTEDGVAVAEQWPEEAKRSDNQRVSEELLSGIVEDLQNQ